METNFTRPFVLASTIIGLALLPACSNDAEKVEEDGTTQEEATRTLAASLGDAPDLTSLNDAISETGLGSIFDGPASYTLLAPSNAAFEALGEEGEALLTEDQRPLLVGLLREHILPGHLTPENIAQAVEDQSGDVTMTTLGGGEVTFSKAGDTITVSNTNGSTAELAPSATAATNGVIIPLDAVLIPKQSPEAGAASQ